MPRLFFILVRKWNCKYRRSPQGHLGPLGLSARGLSATGTKQLQGTGFILRRLRRWLGGWQTLILTDWRAFIHVFGDKLVYAFTSFPSCPIATNQASKDHGCLCWLGVKMAPSASQPHALINVRNQRKRRFWNSTVCACFYPNRLLWCALLWRTSSGWTADWQLGGLAQECLLWLANICCQRLIKTRSCSVSAPVSSGEEASLFSTVTTCLSCYQSVSDSVNKESCSLFASSSATDCEAAESDRHKWAMIASEKEELWEMSLSSGSFSWSAFVLKKTFNSDLCASFPPV